jgi:bifunctional UDP-N-acetylglucosamine pyrophosphorylase/glucosamine-1-phosphate N-acetyltransferase
MGSSVPKVLHRAAGRPLLDWVLDLVVAAGCDRSIVVIGHGGDEVRRSVERPGVEFVVQSEQLGTGDALAQVEPLVKENALLLVLSGDAPLLREQTAANLLREASVVWGAMAVASLPDPGSLGRVRTDDEGGLVACVEAADATQEDLAVRTVNAGFYALRAPEIFERLHELRPDNAQGEIYLPDALNAAVREGERVSCVEVRDPQEAWGVNDRAELEKVSRALEARASED